MFHRLAFKSHEDFNARTKLAGRSKNPIVLKDAIEKGKVAIKAHEEAHKENSTAALGIKMEAGAVDARKAQKYENRASSHKSEAERVDRKIKGMEHELENLINNSPSSKPPAYSAGVQEGSDSNISRKKKIKDAEKQVKEAEKNLEVLRQHDHSSHMDALRTKHPADIQKAIEAGVSHKQALENSYSSNKSVEMAIKAKYGAGDPKALKFNLKAEEHKAKSDEVDQRLKQLAELQAGQVASQRAAQQERLQRLRRLQDEGRDPVPPYAVEPVSQESSPRPVPHLGSPAFNSRYPR